LNQTAKRRIREKWWEEARQDEKQEARIEQRLRKWKRGTVILGLGLLASITAVVPFLYGYPLHDRWDALGKKILLLAMFLLVVFMYTAGITFTSWSYLRGIRKIHKRFVRPGSRYNMDK
jgi:hypothetical protein